MTLVNETRPTVSIARANAYFAERPHSEDWASATSDDRAKALELASLLLDAAFVFAPEATSRDEQGNLLWNRRIVSAVCEEALWTLRLDPGRYPEILELGVASVTVADVAASFSADRLAPAISPIAKMFVGALGKFVVDDASNGGSVASTPLAL